MDHGSDTRSRRSRSATTALVVMLLTAILAVAFGPASPASAAPTRYLDPIFPNVTVTSNVTYGQAVDVNGALQQLKLDVYQPTGDTETLRPAVFWVHGGGFVAGAKNDTAGWATELAKRGYVAISIDYRLRPGHYFDFSNPGDPDAQGAVRDATSDGQAAVRWVRANANELGVDPGRIAMGGDSAGAVLSLGVGLISPESGAGGNPGWSSRICLAVPNAGAFVPQLVDSRDAPAVFFHGERDDRVPILYAQITNQAMQNAGLFTQFFSYPNAGHVVGMNVVLPTLLPILRDRVAYGACPDQTYAPGSGYHPTTPTRLLDTRDTNTPLGPGTSRDLALAGHAGIPADATAVALNVTAVGPTADSHLTVWPTGFAPPVVSNLNLGVGRTVGEAVTVGVGVGGSASIRNNAGWVHLVIDVQGWYSASGGGFVPLEPMRVADTRGGLGRAPFGPGDTRRLDLIGNTPAPPNATALVLNVTATGATAATHLTLWPAGSPKPLASNLNADRGTSVANLVTEPLPPYPGPDVGAVNVFNNAGSTDVVIDLLGYYLGTPATPFTPVMGTRILDTRVGIGGAVSSFGPGESRTYVGTGQGGVPPTGARALAVSITIVQPTEDTHLSVTPTLDPSPGTSAVNAPAGRTVPNLTIVRLDPRGRFTIRNNAGHAHVLVDIVGWYG